jgi:hypothetical protein
VIIALDEHIKVIKNDPNHYHIKTYYDVIKKYLYRPTGRPVEEIFEDLKRHTEIKDKGRNESFLKTFPYYKEWYTGEPIKRLWQQKLI